MGLARMDRFVRDTSRAVGRHRGSVGHMGFHLTVCLMWQRTEMAVDECQREQNGLDRHSTAFETFSWRISSFC